MVWDGKWIIGGKNGELMNVEIKQLIPEQPVHQIINQKGNPKISWNKMEVQHTKVYRMQQNSAKRETYSDKQLH